MKKGIRLFYRVCLCLGLVAALGGVCSVEAQGRGLSVTGKSFQIPPTPASSTMRTTFGLPAMAMESSKSTVTTENYSCRSASGAFWILPMALSKAGH
jgi:hypothetical protein